MWIVYEGCGIACVIITYLTVFTVQVAFIRVGIWEELTSFDPWGYLHLAIFSYNVFMIIASHLKCMLSEPGVLPRDYEELDGSKLPHELSQALFTIQSALFTADQEEETNTTDDAKGKAIFALDKK
jgi:hypothetical protein